MATRGPLDAHFGSVLFGGERRLVDVNEDAVRVVVDDGDDPRSRPPLPNWMLLVAVVLLAGIGVGWAVLSQEPTNGDEASSTTHQMVTLQAGLAGIGDFLRDGKFEFVVTGIEEPGKVYGPEDVLEDDAIGQWLIVLVTVENIGSEERPFFAENQKISWDGREFEAEGSTSNGTSIENLNPGLALDAILMFDVPTSFPERGVGTVLVLHDSALSGGVGVYF